jgi:hypothetical protein
LGLEALNLHGIVIDDMHQTIPLLHLTAQQQFSWELIMLLAKTILSFIQHAIARPLIMDEEQAQCDHERYKHSTTMGCLIMDEASKHNVIRP